MELLITGASSTLGKNLVSHLLEAEISSIRLLEHQSPVRRENCETFQGDIQNVETLVKACSGVDTVLHLAALTHSPCAKAYFEVNEEGTKNLIAACEANNVNRFIFVSSGAAVEGGGAYAVSKLKGEELVRQSDLNWMILRPSEIYGSQMKEGIGKLIRWVKKFPIIPVIGDGSYLLSPVYVDDVVQAMVEILKNDFLIKETLNLCGPEKMTFNELVDRLADSHKVRRKKIFLPLWIANLGIQFLSIIKSDLAFADQIPRLLCTKEQSIDRTQAVMTYFPRKIEEGLHSYLPEKQ